uniref:Tc1-like transposase DDE domain-containing protein n=1 Tax=Amphiprion ocellaris TaxID=80972 RepID=A0AAQ6A6F0_AMPOC
VRALAGPVKNGHRVVPKPLLCYFSCWLRNNSVTILDWPSQSPDLNPIEHLWRDLKMAVHQRSPSNLTELERICKEEWQRIPKSRCEKLVASFPRRLMAVLAQKGASTQY